MHLTNEARLRMNELQIIADCKKQDRQAQKVLYETYSRTMYGICLRYTSDVAEAQDLMQDGFMKVFECIPSYEARGSFEGWIKRIFINMALENIRKKKAIFQSSDDIQDIPDEATDIDDGLMYNISQQELLHMIQSLPEGYAAVFNLYAIEDLQHKEIANLLGISEGTSRSQYARARRLLQDRIKQHLKDNE